MYSGISTKGTQIQSHNKKVQYKSTTSTSDHTTHTSNYSMNENERLISRTLASRSNSPLLRLRLALIRAGGNGPESSKPSLCPVFSNR